jgi:hypothetical protein
VFNDLTPLQFTQIFFSVTQALSFPVIALVFWFGAHQIVDHGLSTQAFFTSLTAVIFGSIQAGNVFTFVSRDTLCLQCAVLTDVYVHVLTDTGAGC